MVFLTSCVLSSLSTITSGKGSTKERCLFFVVESLVSCPELTITISFSFFSFSSSSLFFFFSSFSSSFGGDPNRVTVGGESSGSMNTCILAFTPLLPPLKYFQRIILESGSCIGPWFGLNYTMERSLHISQNFSNFALGENGT